MTGIPQKYASPTQRFIHFLRIDYKKHFLRGGVYLVCIIHASSLGYIQDAENRRHSVLFQGFRNAVDALKLMYL